MLWPNALFGVVFLAILVIAWGKRRRELRDRVKPAPLDLDDRAVEEIVQTGQLRTDEDAPLDLEEIEDEERRFWQEESWDEAEQF